MAALFDLTPIPTFEGNPDQLSAERRFDAVTHPNLVKTRTVAAQFGATLRIDTIELRGTRIIGHGRTSVEIWQREVWTADAWWVLKRSPLDLDPGPEPWLLVRREDNEEQCWLPGYETYKDVYVGF
jgi:hypothetical protein